MNNPCDSCDHNDGSCLRPRDGEIPALSKSTGCGPYAKYLGYQKGLAECEARIHKREQEIVAMYELWHRGLSDTVALEQFQITYKVVYRLDFARCLREWLQGKES